MNRALRPTSELDALVPAYVRRAGLPPRFVAPAAAGLGVAAWTSVGLYPPFDEGRYRITVSIAAAALAAAFVVAAQRTRTVQGAALLTLVTTIAGGVLLAFGCGLALSGISGSAEQLGGLVVLGFYAGMFGGIPAVIYAAPLALVAAGACRARVERSATARARTRRSAGLVLLGMGYVALLVCYAEPSLVVLGLEVGRSLPIAHLVLPVVAAGSGLALAVDAQLELSRREAWLARVRAGAELFLAVRPRTPADDVEDLPRLTGDAQLLELVPDRSAYRTTAIRIPLALV